MINKNQAGLTLGIFVAAMHLLWVILVAIGIAQAYLDWIFPLHLMSSIFQVTEFSLISSIILVILAFVCGYVIGWLFAALYNKLGKKR